MPTWVGVPGLGSVAIDGPRPWADPRAYGALGIGTDDTVAFQAAIDAAKTAPTGDGHVRFPEGTYGITSLNLTGLDGFIFEGAGHQTTRLMPLSSSVHVLDLTGSAGVTLKDFQIGAFNQTPVPTTAILVAASNTVDPDRLHFENLYITGKYTHATVYVYGVASSDWINCDTYNYQSGNIPTLYFSGTNASGLVSTYTTIGSGTKSTSDWTLTACETHDFTGNASSAALRLDTVSQFRYFGGNISQSMNAGNQYVVLEGACAHLLFHGPTFYSDTGPNGPLYVFNIGTGGTVQNLSVQGCSLQGTSAVFAGNAGTSYDKLLFFGKVPVFSNVIGNGNAITVTDGLVTCDGSQINVGAGTLTRGLLFNPSNITATSNTATSLGSAGGPGFYGSAPVAKQTSGANLTNNVTSGGTDDTIANFTDLAVYANDSAAIRNDIYQLSRKVKQVNDALRLYGLLT